jgi:AbrB family looped-hinge helix DNA binding protein
MARVQSRGQVTLPKDARRKAGIRPGDTLFVEVLKEGQIRLRALPRLTPRELRDRYPIDVPVDERRDRADWESAAAKEVVKAQKRGSRSR